MDEAVQVGEARRYDTEVFLADVVDGLIVNLINRHKFQYTTV